MKFYKIVNPYGHNGLIYHKGLNIDPNPFKPYGDCIDGGIYFAREYILAFIGYGSELYEVEPIGQVYENPSEPKKWKAHSVILKRIGKIFDVDTLKFLIEQGADIQAMDDWAFRWAIENGNTDVVKYLIEQGANIHAYDELALCWASEHGRTNMVKYLVEHGADIHASNDYALRWAANNGHFDIVTYFVEQGADIHARYDEALRGATINGHTNVVKYLKSLS